MKTSGLVFSTPTQRVRLAMRLSSKHLTSLVRAVEVVVKALLVIRFDLVKISGRTIRLILFFSSFLGFDDMCEDEDQEQEIHAIISSLIYFSFVLLSAFVSRFVARPDWTDIWIGSRKYVYHKWMCTERSFARIWSPFKASTGIKRHISWAETILDSVPDQPSRRHQDIERITWGHSARVIAVLKSRIRNGGEFFCRGGASFVSLK